MNSSTTHPFNSLEKSQNADSIYYEDLFEIKNRIWMITGAGKSKAASLAIDKNKQNTDIGRDSIAIVRDSKTLYGCWDPGAKNNEKNEFYNLYKIDFVAHCLDEATSQSFYENSQLTIQETDNKVLAEFLADYMYIYPAFLAKHFFNEEEYNWLINPQRHFDRFLELTNNITSTKFLIVPWMSTIEEKAYLYTSL